MYDRILSSYIVKQEFKLKYMYMTDPHPPTRSEFCGAAGEGNISWWGNSGKSPPSGKCPSLRPLQFAILHEKNKTKQQLHFYLPVGESGVSTAEISLNMTVVLRIIAKRTRWTISKAMFLRPERDLISIIELTLCLWEEEIKWFKSPVAKVGDTTEYDMCRQVCL